MSTELKKWTGFYCPECFQAEGHKAGCKAEQGVDLVMAKDGRQSAADAGGLPPLPRHPEKYMIWTPQEEATLREYGQKCYDAGLAARPTASGAARLATPSSPSVPDNLGLSDSSLSANPASPASAPEASERAIMPKLEALAEWLNEPDSQDESPAVRDYRFAAYRRLNAILAAPLPPVVARKDGDVREAWEYSFINSSATGRGETEVGPCLTYNKAQAFGVGCIKQRQALVAIAARLAGKPDDKGGDTA